MGAVALLLVGSALASVAAPGPGDGPAGSVGFLQPEGRLDAFYGSGFLGTRNMFTIRGGMLAAGRGMRGTGTGTITIAGIPAGAQIWMARLYWVTMGPTPTAPTVNGITVFPDLLGTSGDTCWDSPGQWAYSADLWGVPIANGNYVIAGLPSGGPTVNDSQGASIVVFYRDPALPLRDFILWDGAISLNTSGATATTTLNGFVPDSPVTDASVTFVVGDGQAFTDNALFNGTVIATPDAFPGGDGNYWDTRTWNVTAQATIPPPWTATIQGIGDCLVWESVILSTTSARSADLSITKTGPASAVAGTDITYTVALTNNGPNDAFWITPSDTIPAGSTFQSIGSMVNIGCTPPPVGSGGTIYCGVGGLASGQTAWYTVTVRSTCPAPASLSSTASVNLFDPDPNLANNSATAVTTLLPVPVPITAPVSVCQGAASAASVPAGGAGTTYVWTVTNGAILSGQGTPVIQWIPAASPVTLSVVVTPPGGCVGAGSVQVVVNTLPSGTITAGATVCRQGSATASVTTNAVSPTYYWSITPYSGQATIVGPADGPSISFTGVTPGKIAIECTITSGVSGCRKNLSAEVMVLDLPPAPAITAPPGTALHETGLAATVAATAGSTYTWSITNGSITAGQGTAAITFTAGEPGSTELTVVETNASGCSSPPGAAAVVVGGPDGPCLADATTLCLNRNRFKVEVSWTPPDGAPGPGQAVALEPHPSDTGYFWFFEAPNMELLIKVLDGRPVNGKFWVMYGALTDVEYTLTVTDTVTLATQTYHNAQGTLASVADINAFADPERSAASAGPAMALLRPVSIGEALFRHSRRGVVVLDRTPEPVAEQATACAADPTALCLNDGRFRLTVSWDVFSPSISGVGQAVPVTADSGLFWFFSPTNIELAVKVLDGTLVNGKYWVLYGALSDVHYILSVADTVTGTTKRYENPRGVLASVADILAFEP